ncbi:hypothetical protein H8N00_03350 [Streptomyces sp. AC563]|uniref:hypothetical protein n=1 Tax=Streptomyces buecherae TaxID=2763006 RepID=UPI00164E9D0F|nr:hypothetical protein [Streptomyces buecherae]MBC3984868.1 hypothetical protein [Streptomyces buecherae]MBC3987959.1 hypothetical protein [Streptomyces buecherae]QNJ40586.1 hypothetical protein H7H31_12615 [Streptomyces buecherae]
MNVRRRRHLRVVAMVAVVFIALTGARRSGGGGCDDNDSGSSSSSDGFVSGSSSGGSSSGGSSSGDSSSGGDYGGGSYGGGSYSGGSYNGGTSSGYDSTPTPSPTPTEPTYVGDVSGETNGSNCRYDQSSSQLEYDVTVHNPSTVTSYDYSITVKWAASSNSQTMGTDYERVTVGPGQSQTVTMSSYYTFSEQTYYTCQVTSASKSAS